MTQTEDKALEEQYMKGYIQPSKSPYALPFFFNKMRDGNHNQCKIITISIATQARINTSYFLYPTSQQGLAELTSSQNLTFNGVTTMYASRKETNTRQCSKPSMDYGNLW